VYASKLKPDLKKQEKPELGDAIKVLEPSVVKAARQIYRTYYEVHPNYRDLPIGVAINRLNHRGKLIFKNKPVLLPEECFVPLNQIEEPA